MNSIKFHQLVTKTGIISLAALAVIGILATNFVSENGKLFIAQN